MAIAVVALWIAYLVPHRLRYRQQLLESRTEDRFSEQLRVLRVAQAAGAGGQAGLRARSADRGVVAVERTARRPSLHPTARRPGTGGGSMDRPHAAGDRVWADAARRSATERAQRAAHLARRASAARRRAALTLALVLLAAGGWAAVALTSLAVLVAVVPTVALAGVLVAGRQAVVAAARADAEWEAGAADRVALRAVARSRGTGVVGRAVHPSDATTEVLARVPRQSSAAGPAPASVSAPGRQAAPPAGATHAASSSEVPVTAEETGSSASSDASASSEEQESTWAPVPVPRPAYTLKGAAPRREPAPLDPSTLAPSATPAGSTVGSAAAPGAGTGAASEEVTAAAQDAAPASSSSGTPTSGLDLDAILARRRASGE